jgi:hypothetical protein
METPSFEIPIPKLLTHFNFKIKKFGCEQKIDIFLLYYCVYKFKEHPPRENPGV